jgi:hypothetical protein
MGIVSSRQVGAVAEIGIGTLDEQVWTTPIREGRTNDHSTIVLG